MLYRDQNHCESVYSNENCMRPDTDLFLGKKTGPVTEICNRSVC
jgi:hypothetical protein